MSVARHALNVAGLAGHRGRLFVVAKGASLHAFLQRTVIDGAVLAQTGIVYPLIVSCAFGAVGQGHADLATRLARNAHLIGRVRPEAVWALGHALLSVHHGAANALLLAWVVGVIARVVAESAI